MTAPLPDSEDLDRAAEITPGDIDRARTAWEEDAPTEFKAILDATETTDG